MANDGTSIAEGGAAGAADPLIGQVIDGRYRLEALVGEGGMGMVYQATHTTLGKKLAIKVLRPEVSRNAEILARFEQEARAASHIGHEHIVDIMDFGRLGDGSTYFVMEFLEGRSLSDVMAEEPLSPERVLHIAQQLCGALEAAHARGIVHRDMKPDNVQLIERGGDRDFVKVLDFGIAKVGGGTSKLTRAGQVFGTPHYMSPEQCAGTQVDERTDVYAVGVLLYEMSTGQMPFDAENLMGILTKHLYEAPDPPRQRAGGRGVSAALEAVILKCMQKEPEARYQTMASLLVDLNRIAAAETPHALLERLQGGAEATPPQSWPGDRGTFGTDSLPLIDERPYIPRRSSWPWFLAIGALALAGAVAGWVASGGGEASSSDPGSEVSAPLAGSPGLAGATGTAGEHAPSALAAVKLLSEPSGATVYADEDRLGDTPLEVSREPGMQPRELILRLEGYAERKARIDAQSPESLRLTLEKEEAPPRKARANPSLPQKQGAKPRSTKRRDSATEPTDSRTPATSPTREADDVPETIDTAPAQPQPAEQPPPAPEEPPAQDPPDPEETTPTAPPAPTAGASDTPDRSPSVDQVPSPEPPTQDSTPPSKQPSRSRPRAWSPSEVVKPW